MDPLTGIPAPIASEIRQIWAAEVVGGRALYLASGSVAGRTACWRISRLLRDNGIVPKTDHRWERVVAEGRRLYYGRP